MVSGAPARLTNPHAPLGQVLKIALRPYEVVLLEVVADGNGPSLNRRFSDAEVNQRFRDASSKLKEIRTTLSFFHSRNQAWIALRPSTAISNGGAQLKIQSDASVLARGVNPPNDVYSLSLKTNLRRITGLMLEALSDNSLPAHGPGRCYDGNFAVTKIRLQIVLFRKRIQNSFRR